MVMTTSLSLLPQSHVIILAVGESGLPAVVLEEPHGKNFDLEMVVTGLFDR